MQTSHITKTTNIRQSCNFIANSNQIQVFRMRGVHTKPDVVHTMASAANICVGTSLKYLITLCVSLALIAIGCIQTTYIGLA